MEEKRVTSDCVVDLVRYRQRTIPVPGREGREACRCVDDLAKSGVTSFRRAKGDKAAGGGAFITTARARALDLWFACFAQAWTRPD